MSEHKTEQLDGRVCVVVHGWPRLSMTFVAQELLGLEQHGIRLLIASYGPPDSIRHPIHNRIEADVLRLPDARPPRGRLRAAWRKVRGMPGYRQALKEVAAAMLAKPKRRTWRCFTRGVILAAELPADTRMIYAHFINTATDVARYAATITGLPLAASAHARDIWTSTETETRRRLASLNWVATCTSSGADHLRTLTDKPDKVHLIYHGLDFSRFPTDPPERAKRDGSDPACPVELLSVGRAVEKKGFDTLLRALAALPSTLHWRWHHIGEGRILDRLRRQADELGLESRLVWHGAQDQNYVIERYRDCDLFVLPSREDSAGDRDGMPNVLMEAQSQALACLSTNFSGIPELIHDGETGILVPPGQVEPLRSAMEQLIRSPDQRRRIGQAGYDRVRSVFEAEGGIRQIASLIRSTVQ
jgi:glycosyltransferase involved in cell wall biosynthesis